MMKAHKQQWSLQKNVFTKHFPLFGTVEANILLISLKNKNLQSLSGFTLNDELAVSFPPNLVPRFTTRANVAAYLLDWIKINLAVQLDHSLRFQVEKS